MLKITREVFVDVSIWHLFRWRKGADALSLAGTIWLTWVFCEATGQQPTCSLRTREDLGARRVGVATSAILALYRQDIAHGQATAFKYCIVSDTGEVSGPRLASDLG
jgi:uncharacterized membrane-anchored protein